MDVSGRRLTAQRGCHRDGTATTIGIQTPRRFIPRVGRRTIGAFSSPGEAGKDLDASDASKGRWRSRKLNSTVQDQHASLQGARPEARSPRRREQFDAICVAGIGRLRDPNRRRFELFRMTRREMLERGPASEGTWSRRSSLSVTFRISAANIGPNRFHQTRMSHG